MFLDSLVGKLFQEEMLQISLSNIFVRLKVHQVTFHDVLKQLKEGRQSKKNFVNVRAVT